MESLGHFGVGSMADSLAVDSRVFVLESRFLEQSARRRARRHLLVVEFVGNEQRVIQW